MSTMLLSHLLSFIDKYSVVHIHSNSTDIYRKVQDIVVDGDLDGLVVRSTFCSAMDYNSIGIEIFDSVKLNEAEIEAYKMKHNSPIDIKFLVEDLHFGAREVVVRTNSSYIFIGNYDEFIKHLECYKHRKIVSLKRLHIGESERNVIEIVVEEEIPRLKVRHILPYLYAHKQVTIMDWNRDWMYCGNADRIEGEILDRYVDKFFTTTQLPNRLVVLLKHK